MHRRELLKRSFCVIAAPMINSGRCRLFADEDRVYSVRAVDAVQRSNVIDMLGLLTLNWPLLDRWCCSQASFGEAEFTRLRKSGIDVFHPAVAFYNRPYEVTTQWFAKWNALLTQHPKYFLRVDSAADLTRAKQEGKIGIILGMQDANHLRNLDDIAAFHATGQRLTQLTYNTTNRLGHGCFIARDAGMTDFGAAVVARMNERGMAIDVSHCGEKTTRDAIAASQKPVLITHSNCRVLAPGTPRCKSDEAILAVAHKGGVIGLTGVRRFVRATDPVTIEHALDHFDHVRDLVGIDHIGVGSDNDLAGRGLRYDIAGLNHVGRMYDLTEGLIRRGYTDQHIELILGGNFRRALSEIWTPSGVRASALPPGFGPASSGEEHGSGLLVLRPGRSPAAGPKA